MSNTELISLSDREAVILKKYRDIIKKTGLELDLNEVWELYNKAGREMAKDFGFNMEGYIEENSITGKITLQK